MDVDDIFQNDTKGTAPHAVTSAARLSSKDLVCLNFKVPSQVRRQFKIYAARHNMTMTDLLLRLLEDRLTSDGFSQRASNQEIKK